MNLMELWISTLSQHEKDMYQGNYGLKMVHYDSWLQRLARAGNSVNLFSYNEPTKTCECFKLP